MLILNIDWNSIIALTKRNTVAESRPSNRSNPSLASPRSGWCNRRATIAGAVFGGHPIRVVARRQNQNAVSVVEQRRTDGEL